MKMSDLMSGVTGLNLNGTTVNSTPVAPNGNGSHAIVESTARPAAPPESRRRSSP